MPKKATHYKNEMAMDFAIQQNEAMIFPEIPTGYRASAATAFGDATSIAIGIFKKGGNAMDAAVAAAFALAVCEPSGSGLGGQTSLLLLKNGQVHYLDGHSHAPAAASLKSISRDQQHTGFRACTVPSTVAVLSQAQRQHGVLPLAAVLEPAIALAADGFKISRLQRIQAKWALTRNDLQPNRPRVARQKYWLQQQIMQQPRLAHTFSRLLRHGSEDFYSGALAAGIDRDMQEKGGLLTAQDLATAQFPKIRQPLRFRYRDVEVTTAPPPGGGLQLAVSLKILEKLLPASNADPVHWYWAMAEAVRMAFSERERFPVHPENFTASMQKHLLSEERVDELVRAIRGKEARYADDGAAEEPGETTHLCIADENGMVVSLSQSLQSLFGAKVANFELGFLYNNYLTTSTRYPGPFLLASGCIPRSNIVPTIISKNGRPVLAIGAAGSRRIISATVQVISGLLDRRLPLAAALAAPRIHPLLNGDLWVEKPLAKAISQDRRFAGYRRTVIRSRRCFAMGGVQAIAFDADGHHAAADPRRDGTAGGIF